MDQKLVNACLLYPSIESLIEEHCKQFDLSAPHQTDFFCFEPASSQPGLSRRSNISSNPNMRFRFLNHDVPIIRETLLSNGWALGGLGLACSPNAWQLMWSGCHLRDATFHSLAEHQKVNHFPNTQQITRKDRLWANSRDWAVEFGKEAANFLPETFVLPAQLDAFLAAYDASSSSLWICKPSALSRGRGIFIVRHLQDLQKLATSVQSTMVVSRYIANPLLIQGLKFDLRIYVLVTGYEPLRIYVYREGLTRFASSRFSVNTPECLANKFKHLTNYSVNKANGNFVENNDVKADNLGHKWSLSALFKHLRACLPNSQVDLIWTNIVDVITRTILMSHKHVDSKLAKTNCFELFGFDILLDEKLKPWLLEVNLSPSLATESPLDRKVKATLVADTLNLAGISHQTAPRRSSFNAPSLVSYSEDRNRKTIFHALAELQRHEQWGIHNFLRVYPTPDAVVKFRKFLKPTAEHFRLTHIFNQLLYPSLAPALSLRPSLKYSLVDSARQRQSAVSRPFLSMIPVPRTDVHTPPADEQIQDVEL